MKTPQSLNEALSNIAPDYEEIRRKANEINKKKIEQNYDKLIEQENELERLKNIDLSIEARYKEVGKVQKDNDEYLRFAKQGKIFINNDFKGKVPFFAKNLILIGATTGDGKSTTSANLAFHTLCQNGRVLIITNEENVADVYNRVTCLIKGWSYANHEQFTDEQRQVFNDYIGILAQRMVVVDDSYGGSHGHTTTLEGVTNLLDSLVNNQTQYDLIIIDYYQNISRSTKTPSMHDWEVQARLANYLDQFKNKYLAPIVVLAQMKPNKDGKMSFKDAIEGRKVISNKATCAIEMKAERDSLRTSWSIKKSRFQEAIGQTIYTGYSKGRYVEYTIEFKNNVDMYRAQQEQAKITKHLFDPKEE